MILNTYAVLTAFIACLRLVVGLFVLGLGVVGLRNGGRPAWPDHRTALENRTYLAGLLGLLLVGLNLVSWPLLYLLLQSYVPEWSGVMCIYGVTQVGKDSLGAGRFLSNLLWFLQLTKPALIFAGGGWFVLYLLNRRTRTGPLLGRLFAVLLPVGLLAVADASAELTYLAVPKKEELPQSGCCVVATEDGAARFLPRILVGDAGRPWLYAAYYGGNLGLILALFAVLRRPHPSPTSRELASLLLAAVVVVVFSSLFLVEVAAPVLLGLPDHHCAYDLIPQVPEAIFAATLFVGGCLFLGWAGVAEWLGRCPDTESQTTEMTQGLLRMSLGAYLASLAMLSVELTLA
jgi:hypothetical protein